MQPDKPQQQQQPLVTIWGRVMAFILKDENVQGQLRATYVDLFARFDRVGLDQALRAVDKASEAAANGGPRERQKYLEAVNKAIQRAAECRRIYDGIAAEFNQRHPQSQAGFTTIGRVLDRITSDLNEAMYRLAALLGKNA